MAACCPVTETNMLGCCALLCCSYKSRFLHHFLVQPLLVPYCVYLELDIAALGHGCILQQPLACTTASVHVFAPLHLCPLHVAHMSTCYDIDLCDSRILAGKSYSTIYGRPLRQSAIPRLKIALALKPSARSLHSWNGWLKGRNACRRACFIYSRPIY